MACVGYRFTRSPSFDVTPISGLRSQREWVLTANSGQSACQRMVSKAAARGMHFRWIAIQRRS